MKINIESKFDIGQQIYCIEDYLEYEKCDTCDGEKQVKVIIKNKERFITCPDCEGDGKGEYKVELWRLKCSSKHWIIKTIEAVISEIDNLKPEFQYGVICKDDDGLTRSTVVGEENCFSTLEGALNEIEKRNLKPKICY